MNCIDWYVSLAFCIWDGGRLPTEAEWNYAAAAGSEQRQYPWGATVPTADASLAVYNCYFNSTGICSGVSQIAPVGSVTAGNGKWGQSDLAGNVYEWTLDSFASPYTQIPCSNLREYVRRLEPSTPGRKLHFERVVAADVKPKQLLWAGQ